MGSKEAFKTWLFQIINNSALKRLIFFLGYFIHIFPFEFAKIIFFISCFLEKLKNLFKVSITWRKSKTKILLIFLARDFAVKFFKHLKAFKLSQIIFSLQTTENLDPSKFPDYRLLKKKHLFLKDETGQKKKKIKIFFAKKTFFFKKKKSYAKKYLRKWRRCTFWESTKFWLRIFFSQMSVFLKKPKKFWSCSRTNSDFFFFEELATTFSVKKNWLELETYIYLQNRI